MNTNNIKEAAEAIFGAAMIAAIVAILCWITPNQLSAEADATVMESAAAND